MPRQASSKPADSSAKFLVNCTHGRPNSRYMVLVTSAQKSMMKRIVNIIHKDSGNGFLGHTNGSGKPSSKEDARWVWVSGECAIHLNKFRESCAKENTNTASRVH